MWNKKLLLFVLVIWICACSGQVSNEPEEPIMEFETIVHYGLRWHISVYESGYVHREVDDWDINMQSESQLYHLGPDQIRSLKKAVELAQFFDLPEQIDPETIRTDEDLLWIKVYKRNHSKRVIAIGLDRASNPDFAERFLILWKTMISIIPEPER